MLITEVSLKNFQAHKSLRLNFTNGVNIIRGSSDVGKSAVIRAIIACITGKGFSQNFQTWDTDGPMEVTVKTDEHEVTRGRKGKDNYYYVDSDKFFALNKTLPKEVAEALPIGEAHFNKQFGAPYLLSSTPSDVAKTIQSVVDLDSISKITKLVNDKLRETSSEENLNQRFLSNTEERLAKYAGLSDLRKKYDRLAIQVQTCQERRDEIKSYHAIVDGFRKLKSYEKDARPAVLRPDFDKCREMAMEIREKRSRAGQMRQTLERLKRYQRSAKNIKQAKAIHAELLELKTQADELRDKKALIAQRKTFIKLYKQTLAKYHSANEVLKKRLEEFEALKAELKVCPTCGRPFDE